MVREGALDPVRQGGQGGGLGRVVREGALDPVRQGGQGRGIRPCEAGWSGRGH